MNTIYTRFDPHKMGRCQRRAYAVKRRGQWKQNAVLATVIVLSMENTIVCVCESDPADKLDMKAVHQYCWFTMMDADKMPNRWKRNILYWWYMTNMYQICRKGKRQSSEGGESFYDNVITKRLK